MGWLLDYAVANIPEVGMCEDDELKKPRVSVENVGTAEQAREAWKIEAFKQARRANKLRDEIVVLRDRLTEIIEADNEEE